MSNSCQRPKPTWLNVAVIVNVLPAGMDIGVPVEPHLIRPLGVIVLFDMMHAPDPPLLTAYVAPVNEGDEALLTILPIGSSPLKVAVCPTKVEVFGLTKGAANGNVPHVKK